MAEVKLDAQGCRFEPHVTLLRTDQTLVIRNVNPIGDSAKIDTLSNPGINIVLPWKARCVFSSRCPSDCPRRSVAPSIPGKSVGWLSQAHPYMAVSDGDGNLQVKDIPTGKWTFQFWHETARYITQARIGGEFRNLSRGRLELDITAGPNDLGEVRLARNYFTH